MSDSMTAEIARIAHWKQVAHERDAGQVLRWALPRVSASPEAIQAAETALGRRFPAKFREFLGLANGWPAFHVDTDLFGTEELATRNCQSLVDRPDAQAVLAEHQLTSADVMVIGASRSDLDIFVAVPDQAPRLGGSVIWIAGQEIDRFPSFEAFLSAMVNYNAQLADRLAHSTP